MAKGDIFLYFLFYGGQCLKALDYPYCTMCLHVLLFNNVSVCWVCEVCGLCGVCVCVCEREREREKYVTETKELNNNWD